MGTNDITTRDQRVIEHFKNACKNIQEITPDLLADISKFIIGLEEPHKNTALHMVAEYLVSTMKVHVLSLMTTLQNNAEQDDIWPEHYKETIEQVLPEASRLLNGDISIQSLDELYMLAHITGSLQTLSITTSAAMAQNWLYNLVSMYHEELEEHLEIGIDQKTEASETVNPEEKRTFVDVFKNTKPNVVYSYQEFQKKRSGKLSSFDQSDLLSMTFPP
jgi:hypothetical protein